MKIQYQMGPGERGRGNVTEHRGTGQIYLGAVRAETKRARRARRASDTYDRTADGAPVRAVEYTAAAPGWPVAVRVAEYRHLGAHVARLADASARAFVRRWEAAGGREIDAPTLEEIGCIYHAAYARAAVRAGVCPASRAALYTPRANPLPFRALRAWMQSTREANKQVRSHLYGSGAEKHGHVSIHAPASASQLASLVACYTHGPDSDAATAPDRADVPDRFTAAGEPCRTSPALRAHVRQHVRHYADCLRVYWVMGGSRKAAAGLRADRVLLAAAARTARAGGLESLDARYVRLEQPDDDAADAALDRLRKALAAMRQHIASGDVLQTDQPDAAEMILSLARRGKRTRYVPPAWMLAAATAARRAYDLPSAATVARASGQAPTAAKLPACRPVATRATWSRAAVLAMVRTPAR